MGLEDTLASALAKVTMPPPKAPASDRQLKNLHGTVKKRILLGKTREAYQAFKGLTPEVSNQMMTKTDVAKTLMKALGARR